MKYTDHTPIPFGKYKFISLCRVPADYLLQLYKDKAPYLADIREYIETNMETIIMRKEGILKPPPFEFPCGKTTYINGKDARRVLEYIKGIEQEHKKPVRAYECDKCGGWHLTSIPLEDWINKKQPI